MNTKEVIVNCFKYLLYGYLKLRYKNKTKIMFYPHIGMAKDDGYNLMNWKSDNALTLAHSILENRILTHKVIVVVVSENDDVSLLKEYVKKNYPNRYIEFIKSPWSCNNKKDKIIFFKTFMQCSHVFASMTYEMRPFSKCKYIQIVDLGYFPFPFKNDLFDKNDELFMENLKFGDRDLNYYICNSELAKRLILPTFSLSFKRFITLGSCKNDFLISNDYPTKLRKQFLASVDYEVKKILLYTPTHRDYEAISISISRELFGYPLDLSKLAEILKRNKLLIIAKLHPKQNKEIIKQDLPNNILLCKRNSEYGLAELMKISDALITDYTSGYFDYLLLNKPVIFNFYDFEKYRQSRGFTIEPIENICAGEIVKTEEEFIDAISHVDMNVEKYEGQRKFIRDLVFAYNDTLSTQRVINYFFGDELF